MIDLGRDVVVFVGDGAVSDPGIDQRHLQIPMAQQRGDGFETHPPIDGLGGEGVTELVGMDMTDLGSFGDPANHPGEPVPVDSRNLVGEEPTSRGDTVGVAGLPRCDEFDQFRMKRNIAVVAELPDRDMQPMMITDTDDRILGEVGELADPHPGPGQQQHTELPERVRFDVGLVHELGHLRVIEELRQRLRRGGTSPWMIGLRRGASSMSHSIMRSKNTFNNRNRCRMVLIANG